MLHVSHCTRKYLDLLEKLNVPNGDTIIFPWTVSRILFVGRSCVKVCNRDSNWRKPTSVSLWIVAKSLVPWHFRRVHSPGVSSLFTKRMFSAVLTFHTAFWWIDVPCHGEMSSYLTRSRYHSPTMRFTWISDSRASVSSIDTVIHTFFNNWFGEIISRHFWAI